MGKSWEQTPLYREASLPGEPLIRVRGLCKSFPGQQVLRDVSFDLYPGEIAGLLGLNGAGKTTLIKLMCGLLSPDVGVIEIMGEPVRPERVMRLVAVMKEGQPSLYEFMTAKQNLLYFASLLGLRKPEEAIAHAIEACGLTEVADKPLLYLSFGMKRRVGLALAYLKKARILLLDDASTGLDVPSIAQLQRLLRQYASDGNALLLTSHEMGFMESTCDRILVLHNGHMVVDSPLNELESRFHLHQTFEAWIEGDPGFGEIVDCQGSLRLVRFRLEDAPKLVGRECHHLKFGEGLLEQLLRKV